MNKDKKQTGFNIGTSSILMVFVTLCLVSFAALSYVSALADWKLASRTAQRSLDYYSASNEAQKSLLALDQVLMETYQTSDSKEEYFAIVGHTRSFSIAISDHQTLTVQIDLLYPEAADSPLYRIRSWQVQNLQNPDYNTALPFPSGSTP